ncbi:dTDP-4-dehydrorhamnose reductase [Rhodobacteraceae bacterium]|nr:dTDP-4-dehydrorhamnose reductase [Paracoccaceae bacterium]
MKIAVFGKTGQVATELQRRAPEGTVLTVFGRDDVDFANPDQVNKIACSLDVDAVINAVAYTAVDKAEDEPELATQVNGHSVAQLAKGCAETSTPLVHISTDYVFEGGGETPWQPNDPTGPKGVYGKSKLVGEDAIQNQTGLAFVILRTSWVFSAHGGNFVKTMLKFGAERPELKVVADQIGGPTPAAAIADACLSIARQLASGTTGGTYHFSGAPDVSWADFAREIMAQAGLPTAIASIPTTDWPTPTERPLNSRMDCSSLIADFGIKRPDWRKGLAEVLKDLAA